MSHRVLEDPRGQCLVPDQWQLCQHPQTCLPGLPPYLNKLHPAHVRLCSGETLSRSAMGSRKIEINGLVQFFRLCLIPECAGSILAYGSACSPQGLKPPPNAGYLQRRQANSETSRCWSIHRSCMKTPFEIERASCRERV